MELYHIDIYLPQEYLIKALTSQDFSKKLVFTNHVWNHLNNATDDSHKINKYKFFKVLRKLKGKSVIPFEVGVEDDNVVKYAIKINYNSIKDLILVITPPNILITYYLNYKNDEHSTLNYANYVQP